MHRCSKRIFLCLYDPRLGVCMEYIDKRVYSALCQPTDMLHNFAF
jgi:hypothetical protein